MDLEEELMTLQELGCSAEMIESCRTMLSSGRGPDSMKLLRSFRAKLLEDMHARQRRLDRADWIIHEIAKGL